MNSPFFNRSDIQSFNTLILASRYAFSEFQNPIPGFPILYDDKIIYNWVQIFLDYTGDLLSINLGVNLTCNSPQPKISLPCLTFDNFDHLYEILKLMEAGIAINPIAYSKLLKSQVPGRSFDFYGILELENAEIEALDNVTIKNQHNQRLINDIIMKIVVRSNSFPRREHVVLYVDSFGALY